MEGHHSYNHPRQRNPGRSPPGESEKDDMSKKYGHVVQSRAIQKSHALPRSSSRSKSRGKSRGGDSAAGSRISRSNSRGRMQTPQNNHINNSQNSFAVESKKESLKRCSSLGMIRDGKIDEHGRCRNHPNIELCKRDSTNSNAPWRILLQDCPLCSLNNGNNSNNEMFLRRESNNILSGELTAQTGETATTSPSSGDETSDDSDRSNNNDGVIIRPSSATSRQAPPPQRKQSSVQTLKALGKMHTMEGDGDTASISARSMASRRSRHPPPPPPAGRSPHTNSNKSSPSKKGNNAGLNTSMSSLSTKELSRMRKQRYSSEGINERISERKQQHAENDEIAQNQSLERLRAERLAARERLIGQRTTSSTRSNSLREQSEREESSGTFTIPMNDVGRGRAAALDDNILGAAAEIRARARRSLSRSRERRKASDDIFGTPSSTLGDEHTADGDTVSVASKGRRSIMNPHGLAEPPKPLPVQRRSQSRERRSRRGGRGEIDGEGSDRHRFDANYERSSEVLISRRREMRQRLAERQNAADHRRVSSGADVGGDRDYQSVRDEAMDDWTMDTRRSGRSKERNERGRGRSRSRVRDGLSKIRSASLNAFRKKDNKRAESEDRSVDSGRMSFRSLVSKGSRLRSRSRGRVKSVDGWDTTSAFDMQRSVSEDFDSLSMSKSDIGTSREGRRGSGTILGRLSNSQHSRLEDDFDNLRGLGNDNNAPMRSVRSGAFEV